MKRHLYMSFYIPHAIKQERDSVQRNTLFYNYVIVIRRLSFNSTTCFDSSWNHLQVVMKTVGCLQLYARFCLG
jgi:hypothetical protein